MILKGYEIHKITSYKGNFILFYGQNQGAKDETILKILTKNKDRAVTKYDEKQFLENIETTYENILSKSLFEDKKIIIINRASDKILNSINYLTEKKLSDVLIIIEAGNLEKKSKLRSMFEKNKNFICVAFYMDTQETLSKIALDFFRQIDIKISQSNLNLLISKCNGDRGILKNELIKIQMYVKNKKTINLQDLIKLTNLIENHSISELVDNCLAQNKKKTLIILNENNLSFEDCIIITRTFLQKIKRILNLTKDYQQYKDLDNAISNAKPPVFWKDKEIVKQQINNWKSRDISKLLTNVNEIELVIKKNRTNPINIIRNFIIEIISMPINNKL